jgi:Flp pilus assembly protein TadG
VEGKDQKGWNSDRPAVPRSGWELLGDRSGVIYVEYIVLVLLIGILVALAIIAVGVPLLESFRMTQSFLGAPIP